MKLNILKFYISIVLIAVSITANSQEDETIDKTVETATDSIKPKTKYRSLRLGVDISKPIQYLFNNDLKSFEVVGDFRITHRIYIATELGYYNRYTEEDYMNFTTKGSYIKIGANYNFYKNWVGMTNEIFIGVRYGFSPFSQTLHDYSPNYYGTYFDPYNVIANTEFNGLTAHWGEFVTGMKVEVLSNFYMGFSISLKKMISQTQPDNFLNMYIPGFERVYLNETGFSFNYTLSYNIPLYKKTK